MTILYKRGFSKRTVLDLPNPGPGPKPKNDDSVQARLFKRRRFGSPERRLPPVLALLRGPGQQSRRHGATQTRPWSAIPKTRRHPRDTLTSNPHGTAPPTRPAKQQSPWHSATHATRPAAIPMAQRHPRDTPSSNHHGTAAPTRPAQQQSPWHSATHATCPAATPIPRHSATHATCPAAIPMAQRHPRHTRDAPETQIRMARN